MAQGRVNVYKSNGLLLGYFVNPSIVSLGQSDYEIAGQFLSESGQVIDKVAFNPQAQPYTADLASANISGFEHAHLVNVYVQHGRQPIKMSGTGANLD
jgi:hypothetical protein